MAATRSYLSNLGSKFPSLISNQTQIIERPMFSFCFFVFLASFSLFVFSFSIYKRFKRTGQPDEAQKPTQTDPLGFEASLSETNGETHQTRENSSTHLTHSARSLLLEILPSDSPKWESLFENENRVDPDSTGSGLDGERGGGGDSGGGQRGKKKKRRSKKKSSSNSKGEDNGADGFALEKGNLGSGSRVKQDLVCLYPFTSSSSVTQRKIKQQYDELMKCHQSKGLTLAQVLVLCFCFVLFKF